MKLPTFFIDISTIVYSTNQEVITTVSLCRQHIIF